MLNNTDVAGFGFKVGPCSKLRFLIESLRQKQASQSSSTEDADKSKQDIIVDNGSGSSSDHTPSIPENKVCIEIRLSILIDCLIRLHFLGGD